MLKKSAENLLPASIADGKFENMSGFSDDSQGGYGSDDSTARKLSSIEKRIATANLSKKERRLL
jgi:hypothetical protein